jgi:hypothetical protein
VYESINDILIGINESKMLRWLIRNRQQKGIEKRYEIEQGRPPAPPAPTTSTAPVTSTSAPAATTSAATTTSGPPPE